MRLVSLPSIDALSDMEAVSLSSRNMEDTVLGRIYVNDLLSILKPETEHILRLRYQVFPSMKSRINWG